MKARLGSVSGMCLGSGKMVSSISKAVAVWGLRRALLLSAATIGIFVFDLNGLGAGVSAQTGTGVTLETGQAPRLSPGEVSDRGKRLRADVDKAFNALPDGERAGHADEFTALVQPYIAAGTALEDAVGILGAAGFTEPTRSGTERFAVVAEIPQFSGRVFGNVDAFVMLVSPQGLAEYVGRRHRLMYHPDP
jgi:hypothetical protein